MYCIHSFRIAVDILCLETTSAVSFVISSDLLYCLIFVHVFCVNCVYTVLLFVPFLEPDFTDNEIWTGHGDQLTCMHSHVVVQLVVSQI